jgi:hypothetical protein
MAHVTFPKPARGEHRREHRARQAEANANEKSAKAESKARDRYRCRWPRCTTNLLIDPLESAHLQHKGIGGDSTSVRSQRQGLISLCQRHHRGPVSLDKKDLRIIPITPEGADGPCEYERWDGEHWVLVARERAIGIWERD